MIKAARLYEAKLSERGLHDFSGLVATAVDLVENHHVVRHTLTAQYPHLYVDEYQDLAPGLDRVVNWFGNQFSLIAPRFAAYGWICGCRSWVGSSTPAARRARY